jgi:hypothetical protein
MSFKALTKSRQFFYLSVWKISIRFLLQENITYNMSAIKTDYNASINSYLNRFACSLVDELPCATAGYMFGDVLFVIRKNKFCLNPNVWGIIKQIFSHMILFFITEYLKTAQNFK